MVIYVLNKRTGKTVSIQGTVRADGTIWAGRGSKAVPVTLAGDDDALRARLRDILARRAWKEIPAECWGRLGDGEFYRIETYEERTERERAERARAMAEPWVGHAANGALFVQLDVRAGSPESVLFRGVRFHISGFGKPYESGDWNVRRGYVSSFNLEDRTPENLQYWRDRADDERARHARAFRRMMDDEDNDGARPPAPICGAYAKIAEEMRTPELAAVLAIRRQAEESPATSTGYYRMSCARKALEALGNGAEIGEALRIANSYESDPKYQEAVAGM